MSPLETAFFLSSVDFVRNRNLSGMSKARLAKSLEVYSGNSRDSSTMFGYRCKNHANGCGYAVANSFDLEKHGVRCKIFENRSKKLFLCHCNTSALRLLRHILGGLHRTALTQDKRVLTFVINP